MREMDEEFPDYKKPVLLLLLKKRIGKRGGLRGQIPLRVILILERTGGGQKMVSLWIFMRDETGKELLIEYYGEKENQKG